MNEKDFLKEKELLLNSIENNTTEHWKNYYKDVPIDCIYDDLVIDINEIKRLQKENKQLKEKLDIENINYKTLSADIGTVAEYMKLDEYAIIEEMIDRAVELVKKENIIDELEKWLEEKIQNFKQQIENFDIWHEVGTDINFLILNKQLYQEALNKIQELKGSDSNV